MDTAIRMKPKKLLLRHNRASIHLLANNIEKAREDYNIVQEILKKAKGLHPYYAKRIHMSLRHYRKRLVVWRWEQDRKANTLLKRGLFV